MSIRPGKTETVPVAAIYPPDHATGRAIAGVNDGSERERTGTDAADERGLKGGGDRSADREPTGMWTERGALTVSELSGCSHRESAASVWARTAKDENREMRIKEMKRLGMDSVCKGQHIAKATLIDYSDGWVVAERAAQFVDVAVERVAVGRIVTLPDSDHESGGIDGVADSLGKSTEDTGFEIGEDSLPVAEDKSLGSDIESVFTYR